MGVIRFFFQQGALEKKAFVHRLFLLGLVLFLLFVLLIFYEYDAYSDDKLPEQDCQNGDRLKEQCTHERPPTQLYSMTLS